MNIEKSARKVCRTIKGNIAISRQRNEGEILSATSLKCIQFKKIIIQYYNAPLWKKGGHIGCVSCLSVGQSVHQKFQFY